jgi:hypothetical protein
MVCPHCKSDAEPRALSRLVYDRQTFCVDGRDLEIVLGSCPQCRAPVIVLRRGESTEIDGLVEMSEVESEEALYPR